MNTRICPYCKEVIYEGGIKCSHCGSILDTGAAIPESNIFSDSFISNSLSSKYEIRSEIGRGGMATVYKAIQKNLNRPVAIKIIHQNYIHDKEFVIRFHREAQFCSSLSHPNIVTIFDEGESNGVHFMVMEYLDGIELHQLIKQYGKLPPSQTIEYIRQIGSALGYAHQNGLIHRDVKSSNIIITRSGRPVLTDFGIAFAVYDSKLTMPGTVIGTPEYMSPEQAEGRQIDARSDLFSLGVIMYECLTGQVPFKGENAISTAHKIIYDQPQPICEQAPDVPGHLTNIVELLLQKQPQDRIQSGYELESYLSDLNLSGGSKKRQKKQAFRVAQPDNLAILAEAPEQKDFSLKISSVFIKRLILSLLGILLAAGAYFVYNTYLAGHHNVKHTANTDPRKPPPGIPGFITGTAKIEHGIFEAVYTIPDIKNAVSYEWVVTRSGRVTDGQGTKRIVVSFIPKADTGSIIVRGINHTGKGQWSRSLKFVITGPNAAPSKEPGATLPVAAKQTELPPSSPQTAPIGEPIKLTGRIYVEDELTEIPDGRKLFCIQIRNDLKAKGKELPKGSGFDIQVTIDKNGYVVPTDISIECFPKYREFIPEIKEAIMKNTSRWTPGKKNGIIVNSRVKFSL
ncbi:MAG: protein kinase [Bacteroidales bacterium]|nr:protein kinase [Bacteroidales bacterium]